jgi:hypothetical protein
MKALRKKERQDETQFTTKIDSFLSFHPLLNANVFFCRFFKNLTPVYDQTQGSGAVFFLFYR